MADQIPDSAKLLPCPFCGGSAERHTIGAEEPNNAGGDVIVCARCQASSHVEFGRKENLVSHWNTRAAPPAMDREAVERAAKAMAEAAKVGPWERMHEKAPRGWGPTACKSYWRDMANIALSTLSADAIRQGEGETLALRAIKAVTATAKDGAAGLSRIMVIASSAGVKQQYSELLQDPDVALIVERPRTEWAHLFKPGVEGCALPPDGWQCSRARGHSGPCAATPASHASDGGKV